MCRCQSLSFQLLLFSKLCFNPIVIVVICCCCCLLCCCCCSPPLLFFFCFCFFVFLLVLWCLNTRAAPPPCVCDAAVYPARAGKRQGRPALHQSERTLSAARGTFSSASIGTARGRLLSVARKRSMSGDALGKVARAGATQGQAAGRKRSSSSMHASEGPAASRVPRGGHTAHDLASSSLARPWLHPHVVQGVLTD